MFRHFEGCVHEADGFPCDLTMPQQGLCWPCRRFLAKQPAHIEVAKEKSIEDLRADYFRQLKEALDSGPGS